MRFKPICIRSHRQRGRQRSHVLDFAWEAVSPHGSRQLGAEDLEGDGPGVLQIPRQVDGGHASLANLPLHGVGLGKCVADPLELRHCYKITPTPIESRMRVNHLERTETQSTSISEPENNKSTTRMNAEKGG